MLSSPKIAEIKDYQGVFFKDYRLLLKPKWLLLWGEIIAGYAVLLAMSFILIKFEMPSFSYGFIISTIFGAIVLGYAHAYIQLFFHEAAHNNIAPNRKLNDILANLAIGVIVGQEIKTYRHQHLQHHQKHGTTEDPERTYFDPINIRFIVESLVGIKVMKVLIRRKKLEYKIQNPKKKRFSNQILLGLILHGAILSLALEYSHWEFAIAWVLGIIVVMPFFGAVRQVLEHRSFDAKSEIDYAKIPHGEINRLFGDSLLARTLGGAGFNRHLIHHWQPQISCTQLKNVEKFLLNSPASEWIIRNRTTYFATFLKLMRCS